MKLLKIVKKDEEFHHKGFPFIGVARNADTLEEVKIYGSLQDYNHLPYRKRMGIYQHFKGNLYLFLGIAWFHELKDEFVIYKALYDSDEFGLGALWIRSSYDFFGFKKTKKSMIRRFRKISF